MPQTALDTWLSKTSSIEHASKSQAVNSSVEETESKSQDAARSEPITTRRCHPNVAFEHPRKEHILSLKRMNSIVLPIPYPESFYKEIVTDPAARALTLLAFWSNKSAPNRADTAGQLVGAIRCRVLTALSGTLNGNGPILYISTLVVLAPFRGFGIASTMLNTLIRHAVDEYGIVSIGAHVWDANEAGLEWYHKRGFKQIHHEKEYYRKLSPQGAKVMSKQVSVLDFR